MYIKNENKKIMKTFKIQDSNGKRFTVLASNRSEARQKASKQTNAKTIYLID